MDVARRYFRAIESAEGWMCRQGSAVLDSHPTLQEALEHLHEVAEAARPSQVFAHYLDGTVMTIALFD
jgi:hypothetical protein